MNAHVEHHDALHAAYNRDPAAPAPVGTPGEHESAHDTLRAWYAANHPEPLPDHRSAAGHAEAHRQLAGWLAGDVGDRA